MRLTLIRDAPRSKHGSARGRAAQLGFVCALPTGGCTFHGMVIAKIGAVIGKIGIVIGDRSAGRHID